MLKILHVVLGLQIGGLEKFVLDLTRSYQQSVESTILCLNDLEGGLFVNSPATIVRWEKPEGLSIPLVRRLSGFIKEGRYDLVHTHNPSPHFYGSLAGLVAGVPVVHTKHGRNYPDQLKKVALNRMASFFSRRVVAVSSDAAEVCRRVEKISKRKVVTILNGVDLQRYAPGSSDKAKHAMGLPEDIPVVGIVARLAAEKNHQLLLDACRHLMVLGVAPFRLVLVGDGPLRSELERSVRALGLDPFVSFLGMRQDIPELVKGFDIFALSSSTEGVSLTLLEAMACGVPVVATDVGGNPEVVEDGITGFVVPQDAEKMATRLLELLNDPELRSRMGRAGRNRVEAHFSLQQAAERYVALYQEVLGLGHG